MPVHCTADLLEKVVEACAEVLEDQAELDKGGVEDVIILLHYGLPEVPGQVPGAAGKDEVGKIRCWTELAGGVNIQHDTFDLSSFIILEHKIALPKISMAYDRNPGKRFLQLSNLFKQFGSLP